MRKPRVIVVMGVSGSGKSTVGILLAANNHGVFHDGDDFHPEANVRKMAAGHPLDDTDRAPWLARLREEIIDHAPETGLTVLACSALKKRYRDALGIGGNGVALVYLAGGEEILSERMDHRIGHYMKIGMLTSQLEALEPPAADEGFTVGIDMPPEEIVKCVEEAFGMGE